MLVILGMLNPNLAYIWGLLLIIASQGCGLALLLHGIWPFVVQTEEFLSVFHIRYSFGGKTR